MENPDLAQTPTVPNPPLFVLHIAVDAPLWDTLDYSHADALAPGTLVRVPLGRQTVGGIVLETAGSARAAPATLRALTEVVDALPPLGADWLELLRFAANYYQRPLGELMGAALPGWLRSRKVAAVAARVAAQGARRANAAYRLTPAGEVALRTAISPRHAALARLTSALGLRHRRVRKLLRLTPRGLWRSPLRAGCIPGLRRCCGIGVLSAGWSRCPSRWRVRRTALVHQPRPCRHRRSRQRSKRP